MWYLGLALVAVAGVFFYRKQDKMKLLFQVLQASTAKNDTTFYVGEGGKFAIIKYSRAGHPYQIYVPYDARKRTVMMGTRVYLIKEVNESKKVEIDITQQPGVSYLLTPAEMGGTGFLLKKEDGETGVVGPNDHISF